MHRTSRPVKWQTEIGAACRHLSVPLESQSGWHCGLMASRRYESRCEAMFNWRGGLKIGFEVMALMSWGMSSFLLLAFGGRRRACPKQNSMIFSAISQRRWSGPVKRGSARSVLPASYGSALRSSVPSPVNRISTSLPKCFPATQKCSIRLTPARHDPVGSDDGIAYECRAGAVPSVL